MVETTCPVCGLPCKKPRFSTSNETVYKVYPHEDTKCKVVQPKARPPKFLFAMAFVDDRETDAGIHEILAQFVQIVVVKRLEFGDIYFPSVDLVIERKEMSDLFNSMIDKRIFEQVKSMLEHHKHCAVCVSGNLTNYASRKADMGTARFNTIKKQALGVSASILANSKRFAKNILENFATYENDIDVCYWSAKYAASLKKCDEKIETGEDKDAKYVKLLDMEDTGVFMVNALRWVKGIGKVKAMQLYEEFGSIDSLSKNRGRVKEMYGFGPELYKNIDDALSGRIDGEGVFDEIKEE